MRFTPDPETGILTASSRPAAAVACAKMSVQEARLLVERLTQDSREILSSIVDAEIMDALAVLAMEQMPEIDVAITLSYSKSIGRTPSSVLRLSYLEEAIAGLQCPGVGIDTETMTTLLSFTDTMAIVVGDEGVVKACEGKAARGLRMEASDLVGLGISELSEILNSPALFSVVHNAVPERETVYSCTRWLHKAFATDSGVLVISQKLPKAPTAH